MSVMYMTSFMDLFPGNVWLGGIVISKKLGWSDGSNATYTNWATGRPNTLNAMDAVLMRIPNGEWYNENRFEQNPYICELPITRLPCCPTNWTYFEPVNKCLRILPNTNWWDNSRAACIYAGGDLTSIHSDDEEFIASVIALSSHTNYPITLNIGLNNANSNNTWGWSDGTLMDYVKWAPNNPNYPQGNHFGTLIVDPDPANNGWANVNDLNGYAICQTDSFC
uniref:C-type lectin domain-containing protein n=1 Tax=Acrobeloides nanus TaxID=290746 RepID=A0A914E9I3_9BILA